jgi:formylglycine-generating enzyme required for sulfatase activity
MKKIVLLLFLILMLGACSLTKKSPADIIKVTTLKTVGTQTSFTPSSTSVVEVSSSPEITALPESTSPPGLESGSNWLRPADGMTMQSIPAGSIDLGSHSGEPNEEPVNSVTLDAYWIDRTEVTNLMYALCVNANVCQAPADTTLYDNPEYGVHPVIYVNWYQALAYCNWAGARLPSEAEWEKAARGTDGRSYPWGENLDGNIANYSRNLGGTSPVGSYPSGASPYGVLDMAGNVWEWTSSLTRSYPYVASDGREDLKASGTRVFRGGSWDDNGFYLRSSERVEDDPASSSSDLGFRCALSP